MFRHVLCVLVVVLYCESSLAGRVIVAEPGSVTKTYTPGSAPFAFNESRNWSEPVSTQGGAKVSVPVSTTRKFGYPKFKSMLKAALKLNPSKMAGTVAVGGALAAVEWVMTEGTISKPTSIIESSPSVSFKAGPGHPNAAWKPTTLETCQHYESSCSAGLGTYTRTNGISSISPYTSGQYACFYKRQTRGLYVGGAYQWEDAQPSYNCGNNVSATIISQGQCPSGTVLDMASGGCTRTTYAPITDSDLDAFVGDNFNSPSDAASIAPSIFDVPGSYDYPPDDLSFSGPSTIDGPATTSTTTNPTTGDVTSTTSQPTYNFDFSTNPLAISTTTTTTTNTYTNGQPTSTTTTTTAPDPVNVDSGGGGGGGGDVNIEIPTDCDFMPTVCQFIDWVKTPFTPEEVDFSQFTEDKDFKESITITGNAICPAPMILGTSKGDFEFRWEPACQWAGMLKPILIIGALIAAIYISLGIGRSD